MPVVIGRDYGNDTEILTGLQTGQRVVVNPTDDVMENVHVHASLSKQDAQTSAQPAAGAQPSASAEKLIQNQAELEAEDAMIALRRARASYNAAVRTLRLQEESLDVEQARFGAGVSTAFMVILYQSYGSQARSTEVVARGNYFKACAALDLVSDASP